MTIRKHGAARLRRLALGAVTALLAACGSSHDDGTQPPQASAVTLLAGTQAVGGAGQADGPAAQARLTSPQALAVAADGTVYIGQPDRVRRLSAQGVVSTVYVVDQTPAGNGRPAGQVHELGALAIGPDGAVHVAARWAPRTGDGTATVARSVVLRLSHDGAPAVVADPALDGGDAEGLLSSLAFDSSGRLWMGDVSRCRLWRTDAPGARWALQRSTMPGKASCGGFDTLAWGVIGLAADRNGGVAYLLANGEVHRLRADGTDDVQAMVDSGFTALNRLALDEQGRVLVAQPNRHTVSRIDSAGVLTVLAGRSSEPGWFDGPADQARLVAPAAVAVAHDGAVLVADSNQHTLRRIDPQGLVTTVAGLADQSALRDGAGADARFGPWLGLVALPDGSLRVSDPVHHTVRRVDADGRVGTLAGSPDRCCQQVDGSADKAVFAWLGPLLADAGGSLLVGDRGLLRMVSANGDVSTRAWPALTGQVTALAGTLARPVVAHGDMMCAFDGPCWSFFSIVRADGNGGWVSLLQSDASWAAASQRVDLVTALVEGEDGELFFQLGQAVYRRDVQGVVSRMADLPDRGDHPIIIGMPGGLARDSDGRLYVSDTHNNAVRVITTDGRMHTLAQVSSPGSLVLVPGGLVVTSGLALMKIVF